MGNHKFRLSYMLPNAWFNKLRNMSRTRNHSTSHSIKKKLPSPNITTTSKKPHLSPTPKFYNSPTNPKVSDTHFPNSPRKSSPKRKTLYKPSQRLATSSVSAHCSRRTTSSTDQFGSNNVDAAASESSFNGGLLASWSSSRSCRFTSSTTDDIIIDINDQNAKFDKLDGLDIISELELPPILTKPVKFVDTTTNSKKTRKQSKTSPVIIRNSAAKLRANSPRKAQKKLLVQACDRRRKRSFALIVKSSLDPQREFKESMVEMIVENNIRGSKDLEELLACYLSLNSIEYQDLIVKAFVQIWFDMAHLRI
ncbi:transcription repressor OFP1-like [Camellia sinensis]|uniref:Transcription repressor n=1 Tax=Camellia sinensis var. sinensis TaxID=542762 RepID=A0A4S4DDG0_CAMSN|nr:transcription repressor OFP1-like [Camellia sinensis]THG00673.1 hypothetical protein TEA_016802 [Camellia sinensis var. sinensis]